MGEYMQFNSRSMNQQALNKNTSPSATHMATSQALSIKWRPQQLQDVVGQPIVVKILSYALNQQRLHHAYLFTGTRGVGKTTLARIFAKCLSCVQAVSTTPCEQCANCRAISNNQFVDLIEIDAASRTKVDDIRELLDSVSYAPAQGRYKIYLIDEVHMLSNHSFNALLKTLEEPPAHIKFLLATTEPQKLPVTVLSRCLQLQLKNIAYIDIATRLQFIVEQESFTAEPESINLLSEAAQGSLRDALTLLEQAVAYSNGQLTLAKTQTLLGLPSNTICDTLLVALHQQQGSKLLEITEQIAGQGIDFITLLDALMVRLHAISLQQCIEIQDNKSNSMHLLPLAEQLRQQDVQLWYQIALLGKHDLPLAPTARIGFEITVLRMLAFYPITTVAPDQSNESPPSVSTVHQNKEIQTIIKQFDATLINP